MKKYNMAGGEFVPSDEEVAILVHVAGGSACDLADTTCNSDTPCFAQLFGNLIDSICTVYPEQDQVRMRGICNILDRYAATGTWPSITQKPC